MNEPKKFSLLALGDSYTIGEKVTESERFPNQTAKILQEKNIILDPIHIIAVTGWTTDELIGAIKDENPKGPFDLVTLLIGVNNQYRGRDMENYRAEFRDLLQLSIAFAGKNPRQVYVLSIPDWGVTPFALGRDLKKIEWEIDHFNAINHAETLYAGAHYVDVTGFSRMAANDPALLAEDGLHPSGKMYHMWAEALAEVIAR